MIDIVDGQLRVLNNFSVDYGLPKHQRPEEEMEEDAEDTPEGLNVKAASKMKASFSITMPAWSADDIGITESNGESRRRSRLASVLKSMGVVFKKRPVSVERTMEMVFQSQEKLENFKLRKEALDAGISNAKAAGQTALAEQLTGRYNICMMESALVAAGMDKFVSEKAMVDVALKSERGFRLDWIRNFTRVLPPDVLKAKLAADDLKVFDNYLILHWDPENKNNRPTAQEVQRMRDPILFGGIAGSRKLYFIADWIDEYCDLTFDKLMKVMEDNAIKTDTVLNPGE